MSACFALPFERRLILGTEDGKLLLVNYVTGAILDETQPHTAEVVRLTLSPRRVARLVFLLPRGRLAHSMKW